MYVELARAALLGAPDAAVQRIRDHLVPMLQGHAGFKGYCAFEAEGVLHAVSIFDGADNAAGARERRTEWLAAEMTDLLAAPDTVAGRAVFHEVEAAAEQQKDRHHALFAVIRTYRGLPGQAEAMHSPTSAQTVPAIEHAGGFRGFYAFRDEARPDHAISFTLFDTREQALLAHEMVLHLTKQGLGDMDYELPEVTMGETLVLTRA